MLPSQMAGDRYAWGPNGVDPMGSHPSGSGGAGGTTAKGFSPITCQKKTTATMVAKALAARIGQERLVPTTPAGLGTLSDEEDEGEEG